MLVWVMIKRNVINIVISGVLGFLYLLTLLIIRLMKRHIQKEVVRIRNDIMLKLHKEYILKDLTNTYYFLHDKHQNIRYMHFILIPNTEE